MARPTRARLADLARSHAWSFITWCFLERSSFPLDLLLTKTPGDPLTSSGGQRQADDVARSARSPAVTHWSAHWTRDVATTRLRWCVVVGERSRRADRRRSSTPSPPRSPDTPSARRDARLHNQARAFSLHQAATSCGSATTPHARTDRLQPTVAETLQALPNQDPQGCLRSPGRRGHDPAALRPCC